MPKLTIAEVQQKTTKSGKPYLNVKSSTGKYYFVWDDVKFIWHMIVEGATIEPILSTQGKFTAIVGILGIERPNESGGITLYKTPQNVPTGQNQPTRANVGTNPNAWDQVFAILYSMERKIDILLDDKIARESLKAMDRLPKESWEQNSIPKNLSDLEVTDLPDLEDLKNSSQPMSDISNDPF